MKTDSLRLLVIGEVYVDYFMHSSSLGVKERLGGVFHAMRACDALKINYAVACYYPQYLEEAVLKFGNEILHADYVNRLGYIRNAPNIMLIENADEYTDQKYQNILKQEAHFTEDNTIEEFVNSYMPTDILVFPGRYDNQRILNGLHNFKGRLYIDMNYDSEEINLETVSVNTVFLSTSSISFKAFFSEGRIDELKTTFGKMKIQKLVIKENRGGSFCLDYVLNQSFEAPAFLQHDGNVSSVGVGDVFDVGFLFEQFWGNEKALQFSSWLASEYSSTLKHSEFANKTEILLSFANDLCELSGIRVGWEERKNYPIYSAAPDFNYVDTCCIDDLQAALYYHNFILLRPIKEFGQMNKETEKQVLDRVYGEDIKLLDNCKLMIASLLYSDQGTLVEIGYYLGKHKPVILFDPYREMNNMFLDHSCFSICNSIPEVVDMVFQVVSRMIENERTI